MPNSLHPIERLLPRRLRAKINTPRLNAFTEAAKQVKYSVIAVALVTVAEFSTQLWMDNIHYEHQNEERRLSTLTNQIDKEIELTNEVIKDFRATEERLVDGAKLFSSDDFSKAMNNGKVQFNSIAETRRELMSLYAKVASVLTVNDANIIINLDPDASTVDHSERFNCAPDHLQELKQKPSMYFYYYSAACMVGGVPIANTLPPNEGKGIQEYQKKNIDTAISNIEQFELSARNIEFKLLTHIEAMKKKRNKIIFE